MTPGEGELCTFAIKRGDIFSKEVYCNPLYPFFLSTISDFKQSKYYCGSSLSEYLLINPKTDCSFLNDDDIVSFVPMTNVQEKNNVVSYDAVPYKQVKKGFTVFSKGDLIWAKITPCMQNGKSCSTNDMPANVGFGSTEFHIIRKRTNDIYMPFIWAILSNDGVLKAAQATFSGSAGQQRVSASFIENFPATIPNYDEQVRLVKELEKALERKNQKCQQANELVESAKENIFSAVGIAFSEYKPSLFSVQKLNEIRDYGLRCNTHSAYLNYVFHTLKSNPSCIELSEYVEVNPVTPRTGLSDDTLVSFVPMPAVEEFCNSAVYTCKPYEEVKTGFTIFKRGDLLWAKITPCMQNGKSFIASKIPTEIGFGSTEFHVLRIKEGYEKKVYMPYLWVILSEKHILEAAQGMFSGSAGQQRVPAAFLEKFPLVLPNYETQKRLADTVVEAIDTALALKAEAETEWQNAKEQFEKELIGE